MTDQFAAYNAADAELTQKLTEVAEAAMAVANFERLLQETLADGRKLVTVREVGEIFDIPGADLIKHAKIEGWDVVVKAGEFKTGDLCLYFEVDSFLPMADPRFSFLAKNASTWNGVEGARLKTIRLRKQRSQGLALPLSLFPEVVEIVKEFAPLTVATLADLREVNMTGVVRVLKWDKPVSAQLAGMAKGNFPSFLRKSDQERAQNMGNAIFGYEGQFIPFDAENIPSDALDAMEARGEIVYKAIGGITAEVGLFKVRPAQATRGERYEGTIKMDGSSLTMYHNQGDVGVCSRNLELKIEGNEENSFVQMASNYFAAMKELGRDLAFQGELMGPGIQGNQENFSVNRFFLYNVLDIKTGEFLTPTERVQVLARLNEIATRNGTLQMEHVPFLFADSSLEELGITNMDELLKFAEGPSLVAAVREGVVFKSLTTGKQFKVISNVWLENEK